MRKQWYSIQEVARLLQFSDQTIREWAREKRIVTIRPGTRAFRIPRKEVERLLEQFMMDQSVLDDSQPDGDSGAKMETRIERRAMQPAV